MIESCFTMAYFHGETLYDIHDMYFYDLQMAIEIPLPPLTEPSEDENDEDFDWLTTIINGEFDVFHF